MCDDAGVCECTSATVRTNRVTECASFPLRVCVRGCVCEKYEFVGKCQEVGSLMVGLTDDP